MKKPIKKTRSLASLYDQADIAETQNQLPLGEHIVRISEAGISTREDNSQYAYIEFEGTGENEGKRIRTFYNLVSAEGEPEKGLPYLKRDLGSLGFSEITGEQLEETLESLPEEVEEVSINVVKVGKYTNCYLNGLVDESATGVFSDEDEDEDDEEEDNIPMGDEDEEDEDDEEEDEDEDEDEDGYTVSDIMSMSKDELLEVIDQNELAINVSKLGTLAKIRRAVIAELGL